MHPRVGNLARREMTLPNVVQFLKERYPDQLNDIFSTLWNPSTEGLKRSWRHHARWASSVADQRRISNNPFCLVSAWYAEDACVSSGAQRSGSASVHQKNLKNYLHPRLYPNLQRNPVRPNRSIADSDDDTFPFLNSMRPEEVVYRNEEGFTESVASDAPGIPEFMDEGGLLGHLWLQSRGSSQHAARPERYLRDDDRAHRSLVEFLHRCCVHFCQCLVDVSFEVHPHQGKLDLLAKLHG